MIDFHLIKKKIDFISKNCCQRCGRPFEVDTQTQLVCGECLASPPVFDKARAAVLYNDASRPLILSFKHADQTYALKTFLPWLKQSGEELIEQADLLIPVPLHRKRLWRRRYNQSALLADALARDAGVQCRSDLLVRSRYTQSQGGLKRKERLKNVRGAFAVREGMTACVKDKTVLLVDDVFTTGATLGECTKTLKRAGAKRVFCLCIARVERPAKIEKLAA